MPTTKDIGNRGEHIASVYLESNHFTMLDTNWRTRWCEIDIVAKKHATVYCVEVKYRKNNLYGDAAAFVTSKKLQQMRFAAEMWAHKHSYSGDMLLAVISIHQDDESIEFIEID